MSDLIAEALPYAVGGTWVAAAVYVLVRHGRTALRQLADELRGRGGEQQ